jgi:hypothetical protein
MSERGAILGQPPVRTRQAAVNVPVPVERAKTSSRRWDYLVFAAYVAVLFITISKHEPWFDEAQAWLLARDNSLLSLLWDRLRYEGHPSLWYLVLWSASHIGLPYASLNYIGGALAGAGVYLWLRFAPFPLLIRALVPFSFFMLYQYGVIARSYVLLPALLFGIAACYLDYKRHIALLFTALSLLSIVSLHGSIISLCLATILAFRVKRDWSLLDHQTARNLIIGFGALLSVFVLTFVQLYPPRDVFLAARRDPGHEGLSGYALRFFERAFCGSAMRTFPIILISLYAFYRTKTLTLYLLPTAMILVFSTVVWSSPWHEGVLLLVWIFALWIGWQKSKPKSVERIIMSAVLVVVMLVQVRWSFLSVKYDLNSNYSGSRAAARYLKSIGVEHSKVYASLRPEVVALLPYFKKDFISNFPYPGSAWRWIRSQPNPFSTGEISAAHPDLVLYCMQEPDTESTVKELVESMKATGYRLARRFDGELFFESYVMQPESYLIFVPAALNSGP